jgi:hypothetical protein
MRTAAALLLAVTLFAPSVRAATNNDDSCDIGVYPAATLLLPYFEVETAVRATDTFFTVTNVSNVLFLTGYDVQSISMYDVIANGIVAPGASPGTSSKVAPGALSAANGANPNLSLGGCDQLPGVIPQVTRASVQNALTTGIYLTPGFGSGCGSTPVGSPAATHTTSTTAAGYVTIDVTSRCSATDPADPAYYVSEILFDNVLTGDYEILNKAVGRNYAGGSPLVHIRAIPEGGPAGTFMTAAQTNLPATSRCHRHSPRAGFKAARPPSRRTTESGEKRPPVRASIPPAASSRQRAPRPRRMQRCSSAKASDSTSTRMPVCSTRPASFSARLSSTPRTRRRRSQRRHCSSRRCSALPATSPAGCTSISTTASPRTALRRVGWSSPWPP